MHTDSSASDTYLASRSASECTTTVRMPISRQARGTRSAISPRFAMRIFSNISVAGSYDGFFRTWERRTGRALLNDEQRFAVLNRLAVLDQDGLDHPGAVGFDFVHQLHRFDDAQRVADGDLLADVDEGFGT